MSLKEIYENNPDHYIQGGEIYDILTTISDRLKRIIICLIS